MKTGPYHCYFGCGQLLFDKHSHVAIVGWDWFTGYGEKTIYFCPDCRRIAKSEIDKLREQLYCEPAAEINK
jgi:hypothetical protein